MTKTPKNENATKQGEALARMDAALKAALKMPPRKHKDEPKRRKDKLAKKSR